MIHPRTLFAPLAVAVAVLGVATGCSRPEQNAPLVITGDPSAANPERPTTTEAPTTTTTTTLFYSGE